MKIARLQPTVFAFAFLFFCCLTKIGFGQIEISITDSFVNSQDTNATGSFEVFLTHDLSEDPQSIGFQLLLTVFGISESESQIRFTGIRAPADRDYAFAPNSQIPTGSIGDGGMTVQFGDFLLSGEATLESGQALALIDYELDSGQSAIDHTVRIDTDQANSFFVNPASDFIPFVANDGTIFVSAIPEPNVAIVLAALSMVVFRRRARKTVREL